MWEFDLLIEVIRFNPLSCAIKFFGWSLGLPISNGANVSHLWFKPKNAFFPLSFRAFGSLMKCVVKYKTEQEEAHCSAM